MKVEVSPELHVSESERVLVLHLQVEVSMQSNSPATGLTRESLLQKASHTAIFNVSHRVVFS